MPVRHVLATIFLIVFSFQVLPVKELGKLLFKGQMTEEVHESNTSSTDDNGCIKMKLGSDPFGLAPDHHMTFSGESYLDTKLHTAMQRSEQLIEPFVPGIPTPPPNC